MNPAVSDELEALHAIFPSEITVSAFETEVRVQYHDGKLTVRFLLSEMYPQESPEVSVQLSTRNASLSEHIAKRIQTLLKELLGSVVMYEVIEFVTSEVSGLSSQELPEIPRDEVILSNEFCDGDKASALLQTCSVHIVHGDPITDRGSTFQAHYAAVFSLEEVNEFRCILLEDRKVGL
jgi:hypothetical protein